MIKIELGRLTDWSMRWYSRTNHNSFKLLPMFLRSIEPWNEPLYDKTNRTTLRPAKTQISLGIRFLHADSEDSDQTGRMPRLIWIFAGRKCHYVGSVMRRLKWCLFVWTDVLRRLGFEFDALNWSQSANRTRSRLRYQAWRAWFEVRSSRNIFFLWIRFLLKWRMYGLWNFNNSTSGMQNTYHLSLKEQSIYFELWIRLCSYIWQRTCGHV